MTATDSIDLNAAKPPQKKIHTESGKTFIFIDKSIVSRLALDDDRCWCEQLVVDGGILLKLHRKE